MSTITIQRGRKFAPIVWEQHGPVNVAWRAGAAFNAKRLWWGVVEHLPGAWVSRIKKLADAAREAAALSERDHAQADVLAYWLEKYAGSRGADMSEGDIRQRAEHLAAKAARLRFEPGPGADAWHIWGQLIDWITAHGGEIRITKKAYTLAHWAARAKCPKWWRAQLRVYVSRQYEAGELELGMIGANVGQWYCSNRAVKRRAAQLRSNEAMMKASIIESAGGDKITLWQAAQASVSNKAIRRGELMTRIKGCEDWAIEYGHAGLFLTLTCPSRFHSQLRWGGNNPKYQGATPKDAQQWLTTQWARLRAKLDREQIGIYGFRVAEPHHDGCPHWHALIWAKPEQVEALKNYLLTYWNPPADDEPGAGEHRVKIKDMISGQAAGYVAKYVAKNIDDRGVDGHVDDQTPLALNQNLLGDEVVTPVQRVDAWAALWRIRQFQAVGQPPVSVWRELRRIDSCTTIDHTLKYAKLWASAHRRRDRLANWFKFMQAMGGCMLKRNQYKFGVAKMRQKKRGRYGVADEDWAIGVVDFEGKQALDARGLLGAVAPNKRQRWGGEGFSATQSGAPWTRLYNCTQAHNSKRLGAFVNDIHDMVSAGFLDSDRGYLDDWGDKPPGYEDQSPDLTQDQGPQFEDVLGHGGNACHVPDYEPEKKFVNPFKTLEKYQGRW